MTNFERIKAMNIYEMALMIANEIPHGDCYGCEFQCDYKEKHFEYDPCANAFLEWLKSETKQ